MATPAKIDFAPDPPGKIDFQPEESAPASSQPGVLSRGFGAMLQNLNPLPLIKMGLAPWTVPGTLHDIFNANVEATGRTRDALSQNHYGDAAVNAIGAIPLVGPMLQQPVQEAVEGKYPEAIGHAAGLLAFPKLMPKVGRLAVETVPAAARAAETAGSMAKGATKTVMGNYPEIEAASKTGGKVGGVAGGVLGTLLGEPFKGAEYGGATGLTVGGGIPAIKHAYRGAKAAFQGEPLPIPAQRGPAPPPVTFRPRASGGPIDTTTGKPVTTIGNGEFTAQPTPLEDALQQSLEQIRAGKAVPQTPFMKEGSAARDVSAAAQQKYRNIADYLNDKGVGAAEFERYRGNQQKLDQWSIEGHPKGKGNFNPVHFDEVKGMLKY